MKKFISIIIVGVSILLSCSCSYTESFCYYGVSSYNLAVSEGGYIDLNKIWPPYNTYEEEKLLCNMYECKSRDFYYTYKVKNLLLDEKESILYYLTYDKDDYSVIKKVLLDSTPTITERIFKYNNYVFLQNFEDFIVSSEKEINENNKSEIFEKDKYFPKKVKMICYNDDKNLIMALGVCIYTDSKEAKEADKTNLINTDFGAFLKEYFKYYDFDSETPKIDVDALKRDYRMK